MGELIIGQQAGNVIVPYRQTTKRTKTVTNAELDISATSGTITYAEGFAEADQDGNWWLTCQIRATSVSVTAATFTFGSSNIVWHATNEQTGSIYSSYGGTDARVYLPPNQSTIGYYGCASNAGNYVIVSLTAKLKQEPTWAAANMEAMVDANVYVTGAGRGLSIVPISVTGSTPSIDTLLTEKHYMVDMSVATGDVTLHAPSGVSDSKFRVSVDYGIATNTYHVLLDTYNFAQNGVIGTPLRVGQITSWVYCAWNSGEGHYVVEDGSTFVARTLEGDWTVNGDLIMAAGKGIDFSASEGGGADNSLLDDYEEGIFTPLLEANGGDNYTPNAQNGYYTKIGNMVFYRIQVSISAGSGTGYMKITGLPYTSSASSGDYGTGALHNTSGLTITAGESISAYTEVNNTIIVLQIWNSANGSSNFDASEVGTSASFRLSGQYPV